MEQEDIHQQQPKEERGRHYYSGWYVDEVIEEFGLGFRLGNAVKYILRAGRKTEDPMRKLDYKKQDLQKAITYIERHVERHGEKQGGALPPTNGHVRKWQGACDKFGLSPSLAVALAVVLNTNKSPYGVAVQHIKEELKKL
jgi:hypothetical protein